MLVDWGRENGYRGDWTHSHQDNRLEVKQDLVSGGLDFLVTSTIFERGITIPDLDVIVLFADYESIFDSRTLIQIAGRVGRYGEAANAYFIARTVTRAMKECSEILREMNQEAYQLGYLTENAFTKF
jgi:competence protein ComFA